MRTATTDQRSGTGGCSRRTALRAGALAAAAVTPLAGCDLLDRRSTPPADPLAPFATAAQDLAARYDAAISANPTLADRLRPVADAHREHAAELARVAGVTLPSASAGPAASGAPTESGEKAVLADLRSAEQQGREAVQAACLAAPADRAALLGSIAAARATHLEVLR